MRAGVSLPVATDVQLISFPARQLLARGGAPGLRSPQGTVERLLEELAVAAIDTGHPGVRRSLKIEGPHGLAAPRGDGAAALSEDVAGIEEAAMRSAAAAGAAVQGS